jgi:hypothetical protein
VRSPLLSSSSCANVEVTSNGVPFIIGIHTVKAIVVMVSAMSIIIEFFAKSFLLPVNALVEY